ncbi:MAG: inosine/xanthosine triphosphatase [Nanoarchaeota archaeon]
MAESKIIINVGSINPVKVEAVRETIEGYSFLHPFEVISMNVSSEVSEQPISLREAVRGARTRAENSFIACDYSIGLESYLFQVPYSKKFMDKCVCEIYDGRDFYPGESEGFIIPPALVKLIFEKKLDLSQATRRAGLTDSKKIGNEKGIINILTHGRYVRGDQIKSSLKMALISLENLELYR